jgi:hypothetical protein
MAEVRNGEERGDMDQRDPQPDNLRDMLTTLDGEPPTPERLAAELQKVLDERSAAQYALRMRYMHEEAADYWLKVFQALPPV